MYSQISPNHYYSQDIFNIERTKVFRYTWIFVGFKSELTQPNDFLSTKIGGIPVVVQNFNGTLKALSNICSHRFSILQSESKGNRALVCPYHGWAYDKKGKPCGIPKKPLFKPFGQQELEELKLKEYELDYCGDMMFINIGTPTCTLKDYLGSFYDELSSISNTKSTLVDTNTLAIACNWKIVVENTLESYHVGAVHAETFGKLGTSGLDFTFEGSHSKWITSLHLPEDDPKLSRIHNNFVDRQHKVGGYEHYLVYPNLLISTAYGISYNFSVIEPTTCDTTKFTSYVYLAPSTPNRLVDSYSETLKDFNRQVFNEDKTICELAQQGAEYTDKPGVLSLEEKRVHHFQDTYIKNIQQ